MIQVIPRHQLLNTAVTHSKHGIINFITFSTPYLWYLLLEHGHKILNNIILSLERIQGSII